MGASWKRLRSMAAPTLGTLDRLGYPFELAFAELFEPAPRGDTADVIVDRLRDLDRPRFRGRLKSCGDIHSVATQIIADDHHIGDMQSEAHVANRRTRRTAAMALRASTAALSALTGLGNSASTASPAVLKTLPL